MPKPPTELPDHQVTPNPKLEKRTRRQFSTEYKLRILAEADACQHGELGELLRREKLYSSQLTTWRKELAENGVEKLHKTAPGPTPSKTPEQKRIEALERENARLQQRLSTAEDCLSLQKKALSMLDRMNNGSEP
ncbi:transposase [Halomonas piscis]|uniref:Transposase n=1 Tax=Halomonas piscis TaxID=3031727 RepID=A0ABY9YXP7_9GAMM|nr:MULTISPECIES: transposase [Halomonas]MDN6337071.1 transposase [Halomonas sp.]WNK19591.1 transposase [Halomonas piscis]